MTRLGGGTGCGGGGCGVVFKLTPSHRGQWTESVIHSFTGADGAEPVGGLTLDDAGNLYGTTLTAGSLGGGTVVLLAPSGSGWAETTIYPFNTTSSDGYAPAAAVVFDGLGNLYGTTADGGTQGGGVVFELAPHGGGEWTETVLYSFTSSGTGLFASLTFDAASSLYGMTYGSGAYGLGNVFKLTSSNGGWAYSSLYDFTGSSGYGSFSNVVFDANHNLYGTTSQGGNLSCNAPNGCGVVWDITL